MNQWSTTTAKQNQLSSDTVPQLHRFVERSAGNESSIRWKHNLVDLLHVSSHACQWLAACLRSPQEHRMIIRAWHHSLTSLLHHNQSIHLPANAAQHHSIYNTAPDMSQSINKQLTYLLAYLPTKLFQWNKGHRPAVSIPSSSVLYYHLHLPPALPQTCCPHFFQIISLVTVFLHDLVVSTVVLVRQRCHHFFSVSVQAIFSTTLSPPNDYWQVRTMVL